MLEVKERSGRREFLRQDQVLEGDGESSLGMKPAVGDNGDVVVGWDGFEHRYSERDVVLVLCIPLSQDELVVEEDNLAVDVLNKDPERLGTTMNFLVPSEVWRDGQVYPQECSSDRLDLRRQLELREAVYKTMYKLASILNTYEFADLSRVQVEVAIPWLILGS